MSCHCVLIIQQTNTFYSLALGQPKEVLCVVIALNKDVGFPGRYLKNRLEGLLEPGQALLIREAKTPQIPAIGKSSHFGHYFG